LDVDDVAVWLPFHPIPVALVVVAVFVSAHCLILRRTGLARAHFGG
jgi:hypothetical protein